MMRNFADSGANAYGGGQLQHTSGQGMDQNSHSDFQGQLEAFTPEREQPYSNSQAEGQWRWERDGPNVSRPMASSIYDEGQGVNPSRSYYRGQMDPKVGMEKQNSDPRAVPLQENPNRGYEDNRLSQTFEGLERKFMDDITKLAKEQIEAEDAEIARHREKINAINARYQEQLAALRAQHASRRDEILRKESQARQQQYNQHVMAVMDQYHKTGIGPGEPMSSGHPHGYISNVQDSAAMGDAPPRSYGSDQFETYGERARFQGGTRDHGFEPRGQYPGGRVYDPGSRYY